MVCLASLKLGALDVFVVSQDIQALVFKLEVDVGLRRDDDFALVLFPDVAVEMPLCHEGAATVDERTVVGLFVGVKAQVLSEVSFFVKRSATSFEVTDEVGLAVVLLVVDLEARLAAEGLSTVFRCALEGLALFVRCFVVLQVLFAWEVLLAIGEVAGEWTCKLTDLY